MSDEKILQGKIALVTGAGSGIGEATARLLHAQGAYVGLLGHTQSELQALAEELGERAEVLLADLREPIGLAETIGGFGSVGGIDILFANAGINGRWTSLEALTVEDWDETLQTNLRGTFLTIQAAVAHMKNRGASVIVTSSVNGTRMFSNTGATAYAVSKAGQLALVRMLAVELAVFGIRVNAVCPGQVESEIDDNTRRENAGIKVPVEFPNGHIPLTGRSPGKAEQVASVVAFLAGSASSHVTGTEIFVDGAQSLLQG
jgi:NAD(P)-dependent dehydrogenase (short-subunit alcohol dehydrogenase family)